MKAWEIALLILAILVIIICAISVISALNDNFWFTTTTTQTTRSGSTTGPESGSFSTGNDNYNCGYTGHICDIFGGQVCRGGQCVCIATGSTYCETAGVCRQLLRDPTACGQCGNACVGVAGCCNGDCIDLTNPANCGACGNVCTGPNAGCCGGLCVANLMKNDNACGKCFNVCTTGYKCCDGGCTGVMSDSKNCGACGRQCVGATHCESGVCQTGCATGLYDCGNGQCDDLLRDNQNCGECGRVCPTGTFCLGGNCQRNTCPSNSNSEFCMNGYCNGLNQVTSCGNCDNQCQLTCNDNFCTCVTSSDCNAGYTCNGDGLCVPPSCPSGTTFCPFASGCLDLNFAAANCGSCGNICTSGTCNTGKCTCSTSNDCNLGFVCSSNGLCILN